MGGPTREEVFETPGALLNIAALTLSATSQAIPTPPSGAKRVLIQVHGGTVTDFAYLNPLGVASAANGLMLRNAADDVSSTEIIIGGNLTTMEILGTANASTAIFWWF